MKTNPILEEVWRIKDELAKEAGNDLHQLCEETREWAAQHPHGGPVIRNAAELRRYLEQQEAAAPVLREEPPQYGKDSDGSPDGSLTGRHPDPDGRESDSVFALIPFRVVSLSNERSSILAIRAIGSISGSFLASLYAFLQPFHPLRSPLGERLPHSIFGRPGDQSLPVRMIRNVEIP